MASQRIINGVRNMITFIILCACAAVFTIILGGCATTNHDAGNPVIDIRLQWWRVETPPSTVTEFFACFGTTGVWLDQGDGNISNVNNDPMCPRKGTPYQLVRRHGTDPVVIIGGYRIVPPDSTGTWESVNGRV